MCHLGTITRLCRAVSLQLRHVSTIGKNLLSINTFSTCPHNMANFGPLTADSGLPVCSTPANFNSFATWQRYSSDVAHQRPTKLCAIFGRLLGWYTVYTFSGALAPWRNFVRCKIHFSPSLEFSYIGSATARRQRNFAAWYKEWNYGTFAEGGARYIRQGGHHVGHWAHILVIYMLFSSVNK